MELFLYFFGTVSACKRQVQNKNTYHQNINNLENIMAANTITRIETVDVEHEASKFGLSVIIAMAVLIGLWGAACMISGLASNGAGTMLSGFGAALGF